MGARALGIIEKDATFDQIADVRADLETRDPGWLHAAATRLAGAARRDSKDWKRHYREL